MLCLSQARPGRQKRCTLLMWPLCISNSNTSYCISLLWRNNYFILLLLLYYTVAEITSRDTLKSSPHRILLTVNKGNYSIKTKVVLACFLIRKELVYIRKWAYVLCSRVLCSIIQNCFLRVLFITLRNYHVHHRHILQHNIDFIMQFH